MLNISRAFTCPMRPAVVAALVLMMTVASFFVVMNAQSPAVQSSRGPFANLPTNILAPHYSPANCHQSASHPSTTLLPGGGTGAGGTWNISDFTNNSGVNSTMTVPNGLNLGNNQFLVLGVVDPIFAQPIKATDPPLAGAGIAMTTNSTYGVSNVAVPAAFLPNGTLIVNENIFGIGGPGWTTFSQGSTHKFAITHKSGDWWTFTDDGNPIVGGTPSGGIAWENGTYNLGTPAAVGNLCEEGVRVGPSFLTFTYGMSGAASPNLPTTNVPYAVGVRNSAGNWVVPSATNAMPQFNSTLKTVGIQGKAQNGALAVDQLTVGTSVAFPGAFKSLWGGFKVIFINQSTLTPVQAALAYAGKQTFNATAIDENGANVAGAKYSWQMTPSSIGTLSSSTGPSVTLTAGSTTVSGHLWVNVTYNCSAFSDEANISVTPTGGPTILSFSASPASILVNQSTTFTVKNASWPSPITYKYVGLPTNCTNHNATSFSCNPSVAGTYNVTVFLNDSAKHSSNATTTLAVFGRLAITSFTATPNLLDTNTSMTLSVGVTGGLAPIVYNYSGLPAGSGCTNGTQPSSFSCRPLATGKYTISVLVTDSVGEKAMKNVSITINAPLQLTGFTAQPASVPAGGTVYLNTTVSPGTGTPPYTYDYTGLPTGCTTSNTSNFVCNTSTSATPKSYLVNVTVVDASGKNITSVATFTLTQPVVTAPKITGFTATPNPVAVNSKTVLAVVVSGGSAPLTFAYTGLPTGCSSQNTSTLSCTPTIGGGPFHVTVTVTDAKKLTNSSSLDLSVTQSANAPVINSFTVNPTTVQVGVATTVTLSVTGGTAPLAYAYSGLPTGCSTTDKASFTCTPSQAGNYTITAYVNDSASQGASANTVLHVTPASGGAGSPVINSFIAVPSSVTLGNVTQLEVSASGGTETLSYTYVGLPPGCSTQDLASISCLPTATGSYSIRVFVNDTSGSSTSTTTLSVGSGNGGTSSSPNSSNNSFLLPLILIVVAVVAVAAVVGVLMWRRKKRGAAPTPVPPAYLPPGPQ